MLDSFEARLTDLIADELSDVASLQLVTRPRSDLATAANVADRAVIVAQTFSAAADLTMGDDAMQRRGAKGQYQLRTELRLKGQIAIDIAINGASGSDLDQRRRILVQVLDRLLIAFQSDDVRSGRAFRTDVDLGFELDGFRLASISTPEAEDARLGLPENFTTLRSLWDFRGRFWPVEPAIEGDHITALPTRIAVLPALAPERLRAVAGGGDLSIPIGLDLRAMNGAAPRIIARLMGASPPGSLIGDNTNVPPSWVAYTPGPNGLFQVVYRPPSTLTTPARVRVAMAVSGDSRPSVRIAEFVIEVATA